MRNHILSSTAGESPAGEPEVKYPRMVRCPSSGKVILFTGKFKGTVLHKGTSWHSVGERVKYNAENNGYDLYNGPVTITGEDINN